VKHIARISRTKPATANEFQDFICEINGMIAGVIGFAIPVLESMLSFLESFVGYVDDKCQPTTPITS